MRTKKNLIRHEFVGLRVRVVESSNKCMIGLEGKIVDETKNMIKIETKHGEEKMIPKEKSVFKIWLPGGRSFVTIRGDEIRVRPEDRIKKKFKRWKYL